MDSRVSNISISLTVLMRTMIEELGKKENYEEREKRERGGGGEDVDDEQESK